LDADIRMPYRERVRHDAGMDLDPKEIVRRGYDAASARYDGPWWPPLDELVDAARRFYPGTLTETQSGR
jgi:hypothetical protein